MSTDTKTIIHPDFAERIRNLVEQAYNEGALNKHTKSPDYDTSDSKHDVDELLAALGGKFFIKTVFTHHNFTAAQRKEQKRAVEIWALAATGGDPKNVGAIAYTELYFYQFLDKICEQLRDNMLADRAPVEEPIKEDK